MGLIGSLALEVWYFDMAWDFDPMTFVMQPSAARETKF